MPYYETQGDGSVVMLCQMCKGRCHAGKRRKTEIPVRNTDGSTVYREVVCAKCCCHDCIQLADDARGQVAPFVLGQTVANPFSLEDALKKAGIGMNEESPKRQRLSGPSACRCGAAAKTRCIGCDEPLCPKCVRPHRCRK